MGSICKSAELTVIWLGPPSALEDENDKKKPLLDQEIHLHDCLFTNVYEKLLMIDGMSSE